MVLPCIKKSSYYDNKKGNFSKVMFEKNYQYNYVNLMNFTSI